ncbi:MAG: hypothetical protein GOVbin1096_14 [Prokaryotic dsDNA virus sp.]|jgi:hypothetical protein|nr:MAG: hypothetical protein GOVbin1096_14 [Prokaryotic dsDNA virus sp.]|tara:strand:- start:44666 stop:44995 length:330 start_codon:yes stop_codon:yes gene_type:complete
MNEQISLEGFKKFVSEQPEGESIDHWGGGWCSCAVGAYVKTTLGKPVDKSWDDEVQYVSKSFMRDTDKVPSGLERLLANADQATYKCPTYGALNKLLEKYTVVEEFEVS